MTDRGGQPGIAHYYELSLVASVTAHWGIEGGQPGTAHYYQLSLAASVMAHWVIEGGSLELLTIMNSVWWHQ